MSSTSSIKSRTATSRQKALSLAWASLKMCICVVVKKSPKTAPSTAISELRFGRWACFPLLFFFILFSISRCATTGGAFWRQHVWWGRPLEQVDPTPQHVHKTLLAHQANRHGFICRQYYTEWQGSVLPLFLSSCDSRVGGGSVPMYEIINQSRRKREKF